MTNGDCDVKEDGLIRAGVMNTLDQPGTNGQIRAGVMNTLDQPDTIQSGQQYGQVTLTCEVNEAHSLQARLPTIRPRSSPTSTPTTLTDATLRALSANYISGHLATNHQMAPQPRDQPRNHLWRHLTATLEEPEAPSSGSRMNRSNRLGEPPAHTESGAPSTGRTESTQHQGGRSDT
jgi:hypothetical protein